MLSSLFSILSSTHSIVDRAYAVQAIASHFSTQVNSQSCCEDIVRPNEICGASLGQVLGDIVLDQAERLGECCTSIYTSG